MHSTTSAPRTRRRLAFLTLLAALLLLALAQAAPVLAASRPDYTGGPVTSNSDGKADFPLYVPNDYTVSALRFTVAGSTLYDKDNNLVTTAGVQYYVKIRLSPTATPAGTLNRGFTWNPTSQTWESSLSGASRAHSRWSFRPSARSPAAMQAWAN